MQNESVSRRWRALLERLAQGERLEQDLLDELFELQATLQKEIFEEPGISSLRPGVDSDDPRLGVILDVLEALTLSETDEESYAWTRAGILGAVGRHLEAADDYLMAARRFRETVSRGDGVTGDEDDWAETALFHAATSLVLGGHVASAAALLPRLTPEYRKELEPLIRESAATATLE
jgi:AcrR family transcriptional regulator